MINKGEVHLIRSTINRMISNKSLQEIWFDKLVINMRITHVTALCKNKWKKQKKRTLSKIKGKDNVKKEHDL